MLLPAPPHLADESLNRDSQLLTAVQPGRATSKNEACKTAEFLVKVPMFGEIRAGA
jgi:hypothetical protein